MRETSIMDNLNCKMQANARVCKENKLNEKTVSMKKCASLKDHIGRVGEVSR